MNDDQERAATQLKRALNKCNSVGLHGGVYDGKFYVWPDSANPHDSNLNFFEAAERKGRSIRSPMHLDGGSGA